MSIRIMSQVFEKSKTKLAARLVLLALSDNASDEGYCYPSIATIARKAGVSEATTGEYMQAFQKIGLVTKTERYNSEGKQTSNGYTIQVSMIGNDEITQEIMAECRPPSKVARVGVGVLPPSKQGGKGVTPTGGKGVTPESSVEPSLNNNNNAQPIGKFISHWEKSTATYAAPVIRDEIAAWVKAGGTFEYFEECTRAYVTGGGRNWNFMAMILRDGPQRPERAADKAPRTTAPRAYGKPASPKAKTAAERRAEAEAFYGPLGIGSD